MERPNRLPRPAHVNFDEKKADRAVDFFRKYLTHTKGARYYGRPFELAKFQETDIREVFGRVDEDGNRLIREVYEEVPKKNGKSEKLAAVGLKLLVADDEPTAEVYGAAADREQATIIFDVARIMVDANPELRRMLKVVETRRRITYRDWNSFYWAVSADVKSKHGFSAHGVLFDEVHTQPTMRLWDVLTSGSGLARTQSLIWSITTAGIVGESPVAEMLREDADAMLRGVTPPSDHFYPILYAAPKDADPGDEEAWAYCNPAISAGFLSIKDIRLEYEKHLRRGRLNDFRRYHLNQWVGQEQHFIDLSDWDKGAQPFDWRELRDHPCWLGVDLSSRWDLTAVVVVWLIDRTFYFLPFFWVPGETLGDRSENERVKYDEWIAKDLINEVPAKTIAYGEIRAFINELRDDWKLNIESVGYDPMFANQLAGELEMDGFEMIEVRPRPATFTEPLDELKVASLNGNVRHGGHPVLRWNIDCMAVKPGLNDSRMPVKPDRLKTQKRIDGAVAALTGMFQAIRSNGEIGDYGDPALFYV